MNIWQVLVSSPGDVIEERKFLSHAVYPDVEAFEAALLTGEVRRVIEGIAREGVE